jgi:hypothetical protein
MTNPNYKKTFIVTYFNEESDQSDTVELLSWNLETLYEELNEMGFIIESVIQK